VSSGGLDKFFPPGDTYLDDVAKKAAELKDDPNNLLNQPSQLQGLANLALYQTVLYCGTYYYHSTPLCHAPGELTRTTP
jgi:hypothetical protein